MEAQPRSPNADSLGKQILGRALESLDLATAHKERNVIDKTRSDRVSATTENATAVYYPESHRIAVIVDHDDWDGLVRAVALLRDEIGFGRE